MTTRLPGDLLDLDPTSFQFYEQGVETPEVARSHDEDSVAGDGLDVET
jgi:hypothetical protein